MKTHLYNKQHSFCFGRGCVFLFVRSKKGAEFLKLGIKIKNFFDNNALLHKNRQLLCFFDYMLQGLIYCKATAENP